MLAPVAHILPLTTIRRERLLPVPGRVVVRKGQKVSATDIIAEASLAPEHMILDIARGLGISVEQAEKHLQCKAGMRVVQDDVLAGPVGFTKRVVRAPQNGRVVVVSGSQVLLELERSPFELKAGMPGMVVTLSGDRGVIIETVGALVQGVWGNNRIDYGLLNILIREPEDILTADRLDVSLRGAILLAGYCKDPEALKAAAGLPVRGLVLSSMEASLVPIAKKMPFPILVLDGFGQIPMNSTAFKLLTTSERREVAVNAVTWDRYAGTRPELIIQLPASEEPAVPQEVDVFAMGQHVRVVRAPHQGLVGTIVAMIPGQYLLPNGLRAASGEVQFENGAKVVLPLVNLEVLK